MALLLSFYIDSDSFVCAIAIPRLGSQPEVEGLSAAMVVFVVVGSGGGGGGGGDSAFIAADGVYLMTPGLKRNKNST